MCLLSTSAKFGTFLTSSTSAKFGTFQLRQSFKLAEVLFAEVKFPQFSGDKI